MDFNSDELSLYFNEPVIISTLNFSLLTFYSAPLTGSVNYTITGGDVETSSFFSGIMQVVIKMTRADIRELKVSRMLATSQSNTYLSLLPGAIRDTSFTPNNLLEYQIVSNFVSDSTPAQFESFTLDLNLGLFILTFNDVINTGSFDPRSLRIQNSKLSDSNSVYALNSTSFTNSSDGYVLNIYLSDIDLNSVKFIPDLATDINSTYLTLGAGVLDDIYNRDIIAVTDGNAVIASSYTPDTTQPRLISFDFDLNEALLTLYFSETIDIATFKPDQIRLLSGNDNLTHLQLSNLTQSSYFSISTILLNLTIDTINLIKFNPRLITSFLNTYLSLTNNTVLDFGLNMVFSISDRTPIRVRKFIPDTIPPRILRFNFDLNQGKISMFSLIGSIYFVQARFGNLHIAVHLVSAESILNSA